MPIKYNYTNRNDKYAQLYRLQELLRLEYNKGLITFDEHEKRLDEVFKDLLSIRKQIKADITINTELNDITLTATP